MMAPFYKYGLFNDEVGLIFAVLIGIGFGFFLERAGFGNSKKLAAQFYLSDMTVLKVMFTSIITAMLGVLYFSWFGWINFDLVYFQPTYLWPMIVGGLVMGVGFVIGGYCPGTSMVGVSTGKVDGMIYALGIFFGIFVFGELYDWIYPFFVSSYLGRYTLDMWLGIPLGLVGMLVVFMAVGMFLGAEWLEKKFGKTTGETVNVPGNLSQV